MPKRIIWHRDGFSATSAFWIEAKRANQNCEKGSSLHMLIICLPLCPKADVTDLIGGTALKKKGVKPAHVDILLAFMPQGRCYRFTDQSVA